jgi:transcriptional regulator with XRE-family HTH domain
VTILEFERRRRGLTQRQVANALDIHESWISAIEVGRFAPSATSPVMKKIATYFGRSIEDLVRQVPDDAVALMLGAVKVPAGS